MASVRKELDSLRCGARKVRRGEEQDLDYYFLLLWFWWG
jgi:hypothetical protein